METAGQRGWPQSGTQTVPTATGTAGWVRTGYWALMMERVSMAVDELFELPLFHQEREAVPEA